MYQDRFNKSVILCNVLKMCPIAYTNKTLARKGSAGT